VEPSPRTRAALSQILGWYALCGAASLLLLLVRQPHWRACRIVADARIACRPLREQVVLTAWLFRDSVYYALLAGLVVSLVTMLVVLKASPLKGSRAGTMAVAAGLTVALALVAYAVAFPHFEVQIR